ncbi:MAG: DinB family protein [Verrucomicrobiales bacterium]|nr:DinB family protein [Verrucomicrobiales bacterium]
MTENLMPPLAPPGAGLPLVELQIARMLFALRRWTHGRDAVNTDFSRERNRIGELVRACPEDARGQRVLIRRPPGLEDSSRHWSIWMTLDHLRIVHRGFIRIIGALTEGLMPEGVASTAAVKPDPRVGAAVEEAYERSCDDLLVAVRKPGTLRTALRFAHPWFGPLDAAGWHTLSAGHMRIHRVQMERIRDGLQGSRVGV